MVKEARYGGGTLAIYISAGGWGCPPEGMAFLSTPNERQESDMDDIFGQNVTF
jgi:hypothetical protein